MAFNLDFLKEHKMATGAVVIVGAIIVFLLLSSGESSAAPAASAASDPTDAELAQVQAAAAVQTNQQSVALQTAQIQANVANNQTNAQQEVADTTTAANLVSTILGDKLSVQENSDNVAGQTTQQANQLLYAQNIQQMQDNVLTDQINVGQNENANNNATAIAQDQIQANYGIDVANIQAGVATQTLADEFNLQTAQQSNYNNQVQYIENNAGDQKNSALDAADQTNLFATILAQGNPNVASAAVSGTSTAVSSGNAASVATTSAFINGATSVIKTIGAGLF